MSVHQTGNTTWVVRWSERSGERRTNRSRTVYSKEEAEILNLEIKRAKREGIPLVVPSRQGTGGDEITVDPGTPTLEQYFFDPYGGAESFYRRRQVGLASRKLEAGYWDRLIAPHFALIPIDQISTVAIEDWRDQRISEGVGCRSVERAQKLLSKVLNDAARRDVIGSNPASAVKFEKAPKRPIRPIQPSEAKRISANLGPSDQLLVKFLYETGLRPGELIGTGNSPGVKWRDLDIDESGVAHIDVEAGKTGERRKVRVRDVLLSELLNLRQTICPDDDELIVPAPQGGPWTDSQYRNWRSRRWRPAIEAAGLRNRRIYDLRHGFASRLLYEGRTIVYVARQLGNDPLIASKTYAHIIEELEGSSTTSAL